MNNLTNILKKEHIRSTHYKVHLDVDNIIDVFVDNLSCPWFIGYQIAHWLGYVDPKKAIEVKVPNSHKLRWKKFIKLEDIKFLSKNMYFPKAKLINEKGCYYLINDTKKTNTFKRRISDKITPYHSSCSEDITLVDSVLQEKLSLLDNYKYQNE